ncbi:transporter substrate-binding domain-containing protein [Shewanella sp. VB17]|nr:transporter substrate-binding domain-containing protein [Shewanella sp. VB17]
MLISMFFLNPLFANDLSKIKLISEVYPPYNYEDAGANKGIAIDLLVAAMKQQGVAISAGDIKILPWARGYKTALKGPNICLFAMTRTAEREALFKWVGPISKTRIVILSKKSSAIKIASPTDLNNYTIGAIRDDVGEQLLKKLGISSSSIKLGSDANAIVKKIEADRVHLWAYEENVGRWFIKNQGIDNADYEVVHVLKEAELYYAFSKDVSDETINALQSGLDSLSSSTGEATTVYQDIVNKYL